MSSSSSTNTAGQGTQAALMPPSQPDKQILLLDADAPHARMMGRVLRSAAGTVEVKRKLTEVLEGDLPLEEWDLLLVNYDSLSEEEREQLVQSFSPQKQRGRLVVYSSDPNRGDLAGLLDRLGLTNFLARNGEVDPEELLTTVQKLLRQDIFGLEKYFPWSAHSFSASLRKSSEREAFWDIAAAFAANLGIPSRMQSMLCTVMDELTTNALYDAPVDNLGNPRFANLPRTMEVSLAEEEGEIKVTLLCDGRRVGISVADPFGTLTVDTVRSYLVKCFRKGEDVLQQQPGGTGIGLYCTFEALSHLVINIHPRQRTEVIGLIDIRGTYKDFASRGKSLNIFVEG